MESFTNLNFKEHYDSQKDDLLKDFYIPALGNSKTYKRVVGYFNSKSLALVAVGLKDFILNGGKMDLLCGVDLSPNDVNMVNFASEHPEKFLESNFLEELENIEDNIVRHHVEVLGWMVANKLLRIRVAVKLDENGVPKAKEAGILHYKIGLMYDSLGNLLSFSGSINETAKAWKDNLEEFHLFRSWHDGELVHLRENMLTFSDLWNSKNDSYKIFDIPDAVEEKLIEYAPPSFNDLIFNESFVFEGGDVPNPINHIDLRHYQINARDNWLNAGKKGIFEMATGTGKTFTALGCLEKAFEDSSQLVTVITAPTKHLLPQWQKSIESFGLCYDELLVATGDTKWRPSLENSLLNLRLKIINKLIVLTTHDTLAGNDFINILESNKKCDYLLVGDEMHGLGSNFRKGGLKEHLYDFRLGLSATPTRYSDEESEFLFSYFGETVFELTLREAIYEYYDPDTHLSFLTPYNYHPYFLNLDSEEIQEYKRLTASLFKCKDDEFTKRKESLLFKRADIIKDANNKLAVFEKILDDIEDYSGLIIYCSPDQLKKVMPILYKRGIIYHKFTMHEGTKPSDEYGGMSEKEFILDNFSKNNYQALVAMHCLDEGVDVPEASKAIFMCSSNSSREFIQRIGRVIRRSKGKTHADIYDLIVRPSGHDFDPSLRKYEQSIFDKEKDRYKQIGYIAENYDYVINELNKNL